MLSAREARRPKLWRCLRRAKRAGEDFRDVYGARSAPGKSFEVFTAREARRGDFLGVYGARSAPGGIFEVFTARGARRGGFGRCLY